MSVFKHMYRLDLEWAMEQSLRLLEQAEPPHRDGDESDPLLSAYMTVISAIDSTLGLIEHLRNEEEKNDRT